MGRRLGWLLILVLVAAQFGCAGEGKRGPSLTDQVAAANADTNPETRATKLLRVAARQREAGDVVGAEGSVAGAAEAAKNVEKPLNRVRAISNVVITAGSSLGVSSGKSLVKAASSAIDELSTPAEKAEGNAQLAAAYGVGLKDGERAKMYLKTAEEEAAKVEKIGEKAVALLSVASAYQQIDDTAEATRVKQSALELARSVEDPRQRCETLATAGATLHRMKLPEDSKAAFAEAQAEAEKITDPNNKAFAYLSIAQRLIASGQKKSASPLIDKAGQEADKVEASLRSSVREAVDRERSRL